MPWRRIDRSTCWPEVQRATTVPRMPPVCIIEDLHAVLTFSEKWGHKTKDGSHFYSLSPSVRRPGTVVATPVHKISMSPDILFHSFESFCKTILLLNEDNELVAEK